MTSFAVPRAGSPAWREIYQFPPDVLVTPWCPIDDTTLQGRPDGYGCPTCGAAWDAQGRHGRWLPRRRLSPVTAVAGMAGCAAAAAVLVTVLGEFGERLVWWLAAVVAAAAVLIVAGAWLAGQVEGRRYRHNQILGVVEAEVTR